MELGLTLIECVVPSQATEPATGELRENPEPLTATAEPRVVNAVGLVDQLMCQLGVAGLYHEPLHPSRGVRASAGPQQVLTASVVRPAGGRPAIPAASLPTRELDDSPGGPQNEGPWAHHDTASHTCGKRLSHPCRNRPVDWTRTRTLAGFP